MGVKHVSEEVEVVTDDNRGRHSGAAFGTGPHHCVALGLTFWQTEIARVPGPNRSEWCSASRARGAEVNALRIGD